MKKCKGEGEDSHCPHGRRRRSTEPPPGTDSHISSAARARPLRRREDEGTRGARKPDAPPLPLSSGAASPNGWPLVIESPVLTAGSARAVLYLVTPAARCRR